MSTNVAPTNATEAKERLYAQLAANLNKMSRAASQTADLCEALQVDLHAMRTFAGLDAAKFMTVAAVFTDQIVNEVETREKAEEAEDAEE